MTTTSIATHRYEVRDIRIHRPYSHKHQPRRITLQYIAEMSFLASSAKKIFKTRSTDDIAQLNIASTSTSEKNDDKKTKSNPAMNDYSGVYYEEPRSRTCWSRLSEDKDFDGIIETTKPYEHFSSSRNPFTPFLCISTKIPNLKKVTTKIISRTKKIESQRDKCTFPIIDQAKPILGKNDISDDQEADSIDPQNIDAFIRESDAGWDENMSVVEMHEWLPTNQVSLQLLASDSDSIKKSFGEDASLASFDLEAFNTNSFSDTNVFRRSEYEVVTTPCTVPDTSFFSEEGSKDDDEEESESTSQDKSLAVAEITPTQNSSADVQELLNITQSNSFDTVEFYEQEAGSVASNSDTTSAYFSSDNLTQVHPQIVPSVSSSVASSIRGSEADDLLSIPSFPSSSSWDGDDDDEEDQVFFEDRVAEIADAADHDVTSEVTTTEAAYFSCLKFGGFLMLMI